ncbi:MAG: FMN-binding protein [Pontiellaceae bacterium]|nr:FMN-binding protein [Pontiellaceae bacterium]MBN2784586.1 FMN-binding protein [Pontiellaceae bacterium]
MSAQKINIPMLGVFLGVVAAAAAGLLAGVQGLTAERIEANKKAAISLAMNQVLPAYDNEPMTETNTFACARGWKVTFYTARKDGQIVGYAGKVDNTDDGFSGTVSLIVGLDADGSVASIASNGMTNSAVIVTAQTETPGLGTAIAERKLQKTITDLFGGSEEIPGLVGNKYLDWYAGKKAGEERWAIVKDGEKVNGKTGATITSTAVCEAVYAVSKTAVEHLDELSKGAE